MNSSIRKQLLVWLLIPLSTIAASSTFIAYNAALLLAREIYDAGLLNSADSVIARIRRKSGQVIVDLPPAAQSILRHNYKDKFYYQIYETNGTWIAGDKLLPFEPSALQFTKPHFSKRMMGETELRVMTMSFPVTGHFADEQNSIDDKDDNDDNNDPKAPRRLILEVAETRNARREIVAHIVISVLLPQLILITCGGIA
ncbi:MAG: sensor histidine kinase N-terminal domain-containing protein, partial [Leptolyngbya sp.]|nr:sensor histidine kinase N-terminal domain-containing protein [Candidatus Melainabacteria bacterium]